MLNQEVISLWFLLSISIEDSLGWLVPLRVIIFIFLQQIQLLDSVIRAALIWAGQIVCCKIIEKSIGYFMLLRCNSHWDWAISTCLLSLGKSVLITIIAHLTQPNELVGCSHCLTTDHTIACIFLCLLLLSEIDTLGFAMRSLRFWMTLRLSLNITDEGVVRNLRCSDKEWIWYLRISHLVDYDRVASFTRLYFKIWATTWVGALWRISLTLFLTTTSTEHVCQFSLHVAGGGGVFLLLVSENFVEEVLWCCDVLVDLRWLFDVFGEFIRPVDLNT